ncbi:MAG: PatA/PatG family cyanobactin maturation protease [Cyanobacteriota bacterium]|nr:PatA/PatG family cyanobactin maturation protease [Cyanobacteriota bacterium]
MPQTDRIPGIQKLRAQTKGSPEICVAILDGLVDLEHPCFAGANLTQLPTLVRGDGRQSQMSLHGTHVASLIFGQPGSPVEGIAPRCRGSIVPIFSDRRRRVAQLDLGRAIEQAVNAGADIINISGGQLTDYGEAEEWLNRAVRLCADNNVLLIAAAGNDGCECLHVPAALPTVLAVGAMGEKGEPLNYSNWGQAYRNQGILAPGENILGAKPGGGTTESNGTSFATPIVSGVAALLLSLQLQQGEKPDPRKVRAALLETALPCTSQKESERRCLAGKLNISGATTYLTGILPVKYRTGRMPVLRNSIGGTMTESENISSSEGGNLGVEASGDCGCAGSPAATAPEIDLKATIRASENNDIQATAGNLTASEARSLANQSNNQTSAMPNNNVNGITASTAPEEVGNIIYAIGTLGYDFGAEARRDTFKQLMPAVQIESTLLPANPYDARQMVDYLAANLSEAKSLIWTLNIELTPIYALEPVGPFARDVYAVFQELLSGEVQAEDSAEYIERVSIPGRLTGRTVKLFSGQIVPVVEPLSPRGIYGWQVNSLVSSALEAVRAEQAGAEEERMRQTLSSFLNRVYYDLRNLGQTSQDRALNFAATNAFQAAQTFSEAVGAGMELDSIVVQRSPFCRMDSDCWDVQLKFFDPENNRRAKKVFRFTIDVSDLIPVTLGEVRSWSSPY